MNATCDNIQILYYSIRSSDTTWQRWSWSFLITVMLSTHLEPQCRYKLITANFHCNVITSVISEDYIILENKPSHSWSRARWIVEIRTAWWRHQMKTFSSLLALGIHLSLVDSPHKGQWRGALMFLVFICTWTNGWENNRDTGGLRPHRAHYDLTVMGFNHLGPESNSQHFTDAISGAIPWKMTLKLPINFIEISYLGGESTMHQHWSR